MIAELGITLGCGRPDETHYCPKEVVTRAQMMTF